MSNYMPTGVRDKYHVAINSQGYVLRGAPARPAYARSVVATQVDRLAISDLAYSDFSGSGLFYQAQTDWSAGIKSEKVWKDDAKFYYSSNIDAYSEQGTIKVEKNVVLSKDFSDDIEPNSVRTAEVNGSSGIYVLADDDASGNPKIYKYNGSDYDDIAGTTFSTSQNIFSWAAGHKNNLYVGTVGVGNTYAVASYNGSSWTDHSAAIKTVTGSTNIQSSRSGCELAGILYVAYEDYSNDDVYIMSTADNGTTWVEELNLTISGLIISMCAYLGKIYYLINYSGYAELRVFDPSDSSDANVSFFYNVSIENWCKSDTLLRYFQGKLIITIPNNEIHEYDGTTLSRIFFRDTDKTSIGYEANVYLYLGAIEKESKLYWGNLIYDGEDFYNFKKNLADDTDHWLAPIGINTSNSMYYRDTADETKLYIDHGSYYKPTLAKNVLVFNEMAPVAAIDKLLYSVTIIFEKMVSGDQIQVDYSINNRTTWTTAGTATYSSEGTGTKREFIIPGNIIFNKVWFRVFMNNTTENPTTSPRLLDLIMAYKPMPFYKNVWSMRINMSDSVKLLDGQSEQRKGIDISSRLWNDKILKQKMLFEDIDYAECTLQAQLATAGTSALVNTVRRLPRQGRLRVVSGSVAEEMYYTSADGNKIKGLVRGQRGTRARTYPSGTILKNDYDVYIEDITTEINFTDEQKSEMIAQVKLIES